MNSEFVVLTAAICALILMIAVTVQGGVIPLAESIFPGEGFDAKWITNEHYKGE